MKSGLIFILLTFSSFFNSSAAQDPLMDELIRAEQALLSVPLEQKRERYFGHQKAAMGVLKSNPQPPSQLTESNPGMLFQKRLFEIWQSRQKNPEIFEQVTPFFELASPNPLTALLQKSQRGHLASPIEMKPIPLALFHPDIQQSAKDQPELYQELLELRRSTFEHAQTLRDRGDGSVVELEATYVAKFEALVAPFRNDPQIIPHVTNLMNAAQLPNIGGLSSGTPRLDPTALPAWEELVLLVEDVRYKQMLLSLIDPIATQDSVPCYGVILKQAIQGYKLGERDEKCTWLIFQTLDFFRDHPSRSAAIALAQAKRFANEGNDAYELPIGDRLSMKGWRDLLSEMETEGPYRDTARELSPVER